MTRGVVYTVFGEDYARMAARSAASVREHAPGVGLVLQSDRGVTDEVASVFDRVEVAAGEFGWGERIRRFRDLPFDRTLRLDADTLVVGSLDGAFDLLEQYDVAMALAPVGRGPSDPDGLTPDCFYMLNCGVLFARRCERVDRMMALWDELYEREQVRDPGGRASIDDQPTLRWAAWRSGVNLYVLPPEYNVRARHPCFLREGPVIVHELGGGLGALGEIYSWGRGSRVLGPTRPVGASPEVDSTGQGGAWIDEFTGGELVSVYPRVVVFYGTDGSHGSTFFAQRYPRAKVAMLGWGSDAYKRSKLASAHIGNLLALGPGHMKDGLGAWCEGRGIGRIDVLRIGTSEQGARDVDDEWVRRRVRYLIDEEGSRAARLGFVRVGARGVWANPSV